MPSPIDPTTARKVWRTLEPYHGMIYFVPEAAEAYARLGITGRHGYFASRAAPMGAVSAEVVVSTFFNFNPEVVHAAIPSSWNVAAPSAIIDARFGAADAALRRVLGDAVASPEMSEAATLARYGRGRGLLRRPSARRRPRSTSLARRRPPRPLACDERPP